MRSCAACVFFAEEPHVWILEKYDGFCFFNPPDSDGNVSTVKSKYSFCGHFEPKYRPGDYNYR